MSATKSVPLCKVQSKRAFTLIELLVVIGVIAILAGGLGVALRGFDGRAKIQNAQTALIGSFNGARAQAAVKQTSITLLLNADPDSENCLRELIPVTGSPGNWRIAGESTFLPVGMYVVPPKIEAAFSATVVAKYDSPSVAADWAKIKSYASKEEPDSTTDILVAAPDTSSDVVRTVAKTFELVGFDSLGRFNLTTAITTPGLTTTYVIAPGEPTPGKGVTFRDHEAVRGLWISRYGVTVNVNEKAGFDYTAADYDKR